MDRTIFTLMTEFLDIDRYLATRIIDWYNDHPTKEISPADVWAAPFRPQLTQLGIEEYELADYLGISLEDRVNSKEYHAILNQHYCSNYDPNDDSNIYASGSNQFEDVEIPDDDDISLKVIFDHMVEVICPVCWVKEYKENPAKAEDFLDLHYKIHVKESGWVPEGLE